MDKKELKQEQLENVSGGIDEATNPISGAGIGGGKDAIIVGQQTLVDNDNNENS